MENLIVSGLIHEPNSYADDTALLVGDSPLSQQLEEIKNKFVTVRFFISDTEKTKQELLKDLILTISGSADVDYGNVYSECTGYLWTNDNLVIGGHDIIDMMCYHIGKYAYIEVDIHDTNPAS